MNITNNKSIFYSLVLLATLALSLIVLFPTETKAAVCWDNAGYVFSANTCGGSNFTSGYYNQNNYSLNPAPMIYAVSPNAVPALMKSNMVVTLTGGNFIPNSLAQFNNSYRPTSFIDSSRVNVTLNESDLKTIGSYVITVFNPMPGGGTSNGVSFNVNSGMLANNTALTSNTASASVKVAKTKTTTLAKTPTVAGTTDTNYSGLAATALFGLGLNSCNGFLPSGLIQWLLLAILILVIILLGRKLYSTNNYHAEPLKHA